MPIAKKDAEAALASVMQDHAPAARAAAAHAAVDSLRGELAAAITPEQVNVARLKADVLKTWLRKAVEAGASEVAEAAREGQVLSLEASCTLGEGALPPEREPASQAAGHVSRYRGPGLTKGVKQQAETAKTKREIVRRCALLAIARRHEPDRFSELVGEALDAGKPIPVTKLCGLARAERADPDEGDAPPAEEQVKIRLTPGQAVKVDALRGDVDRTKWVFALVEDVALVDPLDSARLLLERVEHALERAPGARGKRDRAAAHVARALVELRGGS